MGKFAKSKDKFLQEQPFTLSTPKIPLKIAQAFLVGFGLTNAFLILARYCGGTLQYVVCCIDGEKR